MPGMMDTILNLGLNETSLQGLIKQTANERFAYDAYRRFIQLFGKIALGIGDEHFDERMAAIKRKYGARLDLDLDAAHLKELAGEFLAIVEAPYRQAVPAGSVRAAGNLGRRGVSFLDGQARGRLPQAVQDHARTWPTAPRSTSAPWCSATWATIPAPAWASRATPAPARTLIYGEYLVNAQGEDVVAGIRTPKPIAEMEQEMPEIYRQLMELHNRLESHYHEVQDFEFTIEKGTLYCLQTRNGKMNARAMVRTSVEMFHEGLISKERALLRVEPAMLEQLLVPQLSPDFHGKSLAQGLPASPGAASGKIVFDADTRREHAAAPAKRSSWCARKPSRRTSTASSRRRASSPAAAARPRTPRWWRAAWASPASRAASRS